MENLVDKSQLIRDAQRGDLQAFTELVKRHQAQVRACLVVRMENRHEADDLAQEAFIVAFEKLGEFDADRPFGPWIRSVAFNLLRNHCRKNRPAAVGGSAELEALIDESVAARHPLPNESDRLAALRQCIQNLNESMSSLVQLRYREERSLAEVREALAIKHSTLTMRLHRLRAVLRQCVKRRLGKAGA